MKKKIFGLLCAVLLLTTAALPALAAPVAPISPAPAWTLEVEGKAVELQGKLPYQAGEHLMVPLRAVAEALGYTVEWDGATHSIVLENGVYNTKVTIGEDRYFRANSKMPGMTALQNYGQAPELKNDTTFVPTELWKLLNCTVKVEESNISIANGEAVEIPNPMVSYESVEAAEKAAGITVPELKSLPEGYQLNKIYVIGGTLVQLIYQNGNDRILYRAEKGDADISGDYNQYSVIKTVQIGALQVAVKGDADKLSVATWTADGLTFALSFDQAVTEAELTAMLLK